MLGPRIRVVLPLVLSAAGFALAMVALFAGSTPGQMEDMNIVSINVSNFGHDVLEKVVNGTLNNFTQQATATTGSSTPTSTDSSWWGRVTATIGSVIQQGEDKAKEAAKELISDLNGVANNATEEVLDDLKVAQWYSLHVMTLCQGDADRNISVNCTEKKAGFHLDLPDLANLDLDKNVTNKVKDLINNQVNRLSDGVVKTLLQQLVQRLPNISVPKDLLQYPDDVKSAVNMLNSGLLALFVFFVLGAGFSGLAIIFALLSLLSLSMLLTIANVVNALLAAITLAVSAIIATVISKKAESIINDKGQLVGITAAAGSKFLGVIWAAFAVMFLAFIFWAVPPCHGRRQARRAAGRVSDREKAAMAKESMDSGRSQRRIFGRRG